MSRPVRSSFCLECGVPFVGVGSRCPLHGRPDVRPSRVERDRRGRRAWARVRARALRRDGGCCVRCGEGRLGLQVHHVRALSAGGSDDLGNLVTLCVACHAEFHT